MQDIHVCVLISFISNEIQCKVSGKNLWLEGDSERVLRKTLETREYSRVLRVKPSKHHEEYCFPTSVEFPFCKCCNPHFFARNS